MQNVVIFVGIVGAVCSILAIIAFAWKCIKNISPKHKGVSFYKLISRNFLNSVDLNEKVKLEQVRRYAIMALAITLAWLLVWGGVVIVWAKLQGVKL